MYTLLAALLIAQTPQTIWVDTTDIFNANLTAKVIPVVAFYDKDGKLRLIMINPGPGPIPPAPPNPNPPPPPAPGNYGITLPIATTVKAAIAANKITKTDTIALANAYSATQSAINTAAVAVTPMSKTDAQNLLISKTHAALGATISPDWVAVLDTIVARMKTLGATLKSSKELSDFYGEVAAGLVYGAQ